MRGPPRIAETSSTKNLAFVAAGNSSSLYAIVLQCVPQTCLKKNVNAFENQQETIDETLHNIMEGAFEKVFPAIIKHVEKISTMVSLFLVENNHMKAANYVVFAAIILLLILLSMVLFALMLLLTR
ncbi:hypothetical protein Y032_0002g898 [Ancylostoma ceylanicum]|nr:hypothetical protein Y032_0002g898 [Ancylostoma ceylanicum]